jgi:hypothetical protein
VLQEKVSLVLQEKKTLAIGGLAPRVCPRTHDGSITRGGTIHAIEKASGRDGAGSFGLAGGSPDRRTRNGCEPGSACQHAAAHYWRNAPGREDSDTRSVRPSSAARTTWVRCSALVIKTQLRRRRHTAATRSRSRSGRPSMSPRGQSMSFPLRASRRSWAAACWSAQPAFQQFPAQRPSLLRARSAPHQRGQQPLRCLRHSRPLG